LGSGFSLVSQYLNAGFCQKCCPFLDSLLELFLEPKFLTQKP
jgi:hypothetical protein